MADSDSQTRERVRARYAAAATAVTRGSRDVLDLVDAQQSCCSPSDNVSCCGGTGKVDEAFGPSLYSADRAERGSYVGCIAGALSRSEYLDGLAAIGFTDAEVTFTRGAAPGMHSALVRAVKPAGA